MRNPRETNAPRPEIPRPPRPGPTRQRVNQLAADVRRFLKSWDKEQPPTVGELAKDFGVRFSQLRKETGWKELENMFSKPVKKFKTWLSTIKSVQVHGEKVKLGGNASKKRR